jgi:hypothetical protein
MKRSTVRIEDDLMRAVEERSRKRKVSLTRAFNDMLRDGLRSQGTETRRRRFRQRTYPMGTPLVDLTKALSLAAAMEDEEVLRKWALKK